MNSERCTDLLSRLGALLQGLDDVGRTAGEALLEELRNEAERQLGAAQQLAESQADAIVNAGMMMSELEETHAKLESARRAAESASRAKSDFLANMSHEIRTPMNGVIGVLQLVLEGELPDGQRHRLEIAARSANSLLNLLNDLLEFSKLEAGALRYERRAFDLSAVVSDVGALFAPACEGKGLALELRVDPALHSGYIGDPHRIAQILTNLVGNAVKFTERGRVTIDVRRVAGGAQGDALQIDVRDTGIGMTPQTLAGLFHPFEQVDASMSRRFGGTGLGLAISSRLAQGMQGRVTAMSQPDVGSCLTLHLTLERSTKAAAVAAPAETVTGEEWSYPQARVLLVEDNVVNQAVALAMLDSYGLHIDTAGDGREALARQMASSYDLVLMDCQMPELNGLDATREWRRRERAAGLAAVPIIALTAHAMAGDQEVCLAAGMNDYLAKPFTRAQLAAVLHRHLRSFERPVAARRAG